MKLSLIIPVYNEAQRLPGGLTTAINYLKRQSYSWEIIVVDDGSTDSSTSEVAEWTPRTVKLIKTARNFGKGHAIRLGVAASEGDYIIFSDIDFSVPPEFISPFLAKLKSVDIVIGSRRLAGSIIAQHQHFWRESLGQGFTKLSNLILGLNHSDLTCGFKAFRAQIAKDLFSRQRLNGWAFDSEILFLARKLGYPVAEIPVSWRNHPLTKVNLAKDIANSFWSLIYIRCSHL
jgi:dolichyl-phosphate beta-glucosyltransferase